MILLFIHFINLLIKLLSNFKYGKIQTQLQLICYYFVDPNINDFDFLAEYLANAISSINNRFKYNKY